MNLIKTTAFVEDEEHLKLNQKLKALQKGTEVELAIFIRGDRKNNWKEELKSIGSYNDDELSI